LWAGRSLCVGLSPVLDDVDRGSAKALISHIKNDELSGRDGPLWRVETNRQTIVA
jgi:hypothetical protein